MASHASFRDQSRGVFSCGHVMRGERPALLVSRSEGDWQFVCGKQDHDPRNEPYHVSIRVLVSRDPSLNDVADLSSGWDAERSALGAPWIKTKAGTVDA